MGAIETLLTSVDGIILGFVQGSYTGLAGTIRALWQLMFIVFIAFYGYKIMVSGRFSPSDLIVHCVKIIILLVLATEWSSFFTFVYRMVTDLPSDIAGQIMQSAASSLGSSAANSQASANGALSAFFDRGMLVMQKIVEGAGWSDIGLYLYAGAVGIGTIGFTGYASMLIIMAKVAVALLLAVSPIFILLLMFSHTRGLFEGWLRTLLNYAIVPVFVYTLLAFLLTLAEHPLENLEAHSTLKTALLTGVGPFVLITFVSILLLMQIMNMASSVTGALSLSTLGMYAGSARFLGGFGGAASAWGWRMATRRREKQEDKPEDKGQTQDKGQEGRDALSQSLQANRGVS